MIMRLLVTSLVLVSVGAIGACRLGPNSNNVGLDCSNSNDCDDPDDALACVSTKDDNANIDANNPDGICLPPPEGWTCQGDFWNDEDDFCDCGCGIVDADCGIDETSGACDENNCTGDQVPDAADNSKCVDP